MEKQIISVERLLANSEIYAGKTVTLEGMFMASFYELGLVSLSVNIETYDLSDKIMIEHPDLADKCFAALSPWIGAKFYYHDKATITGKFIKGAMPALINLTNFKIIRAGKEYEILVA